MIKNKLGLALTMSLVICGLFLVNSSEKPAVTAGTAAGPARFSVLLFSKTAGFRHGSITDGQAAVQTLAADNNFAVDLSENAADINDANLANYAAVIFLHTTGDFLNDTQQGALERYVQAGNGFVGIHAAADAEYGWAWYGGLVGAYFDSHPAVQEADMIVANSTHPSTAHLSTTWTRTDEWYNFQSDPSSNVNVLLSLDESSYSGGTMGSSHPIAWYHFYDGGRSWYTGLGHTAATFSEPDFLQHLLGGIEWAAGVEKVSGTLRQWQPLTLSFVGPTAGEMDDASNPFLDYRLQVVFTGPNGQQYDVPGFFAGDGLGGGRGSIWQVRFSPDEAGEWTYTASFRTGADVAVDLNPAAGTPTAFDGASGTFIVSPLDPNAPGFLKWGRLSYVDGHYLKFADGPYWIKGGTDSPENFLGYRGFDNTVDQVGGAAPNFLHEYAPHVADWQPGDPNFVSADSGVDGKGIIGALNYLSDQHVNSIYFLPMNLGGDGRETYPFVAANNTTFNKTHYDISKLHQWHIVLNHAQENGIALHVVLAETESGNENWFDGDALGVERKLYYRELVARFGHFLALKWNLSEENDFSVANLRAFADYIQALDSAGHPITVHTKPNNFSDYNQIVGDDRFSTTSIQYRVDLANDHVEGWRASSAAAGRPWVVDMDENNPAGSGLTDSNAADLRKQALYDIYFSGGHVEWYGGYHDLPLGGDMRMEDFRTREEMWQYMWYARRFMQLYLPFWEMTPADDLLSGEDDLYGGGQVFAKAGSVYAVYLPDASPSGTLDLSALAPGQTVELRWYNPRTGEFAGTPTAITGPGAVPLGPPPDSANEDWVVLLSPPVETTYLPFVRR
ncbi:MAG: ThuA domain-containing protein [Ardenticatenaceae bacterium]|nr:ThuA domain-containing protein [Ardenticatenaceae bacterium]